MPKKTIMKQAETGLSGEKRHGRYSDQATGREPTDRELEQHRNADVLSEDEWFNS
jgi:hypothetical protein